MAMPAAAPAAAPSRATGAAESGGYSSPVVNGAPRSTSLDIDDELDVPDFLK